LPSAVIDDIGRRHARGGRFAMMPMRLPRVIACERR
jgi:hypothetical protein